LLSKRQERLEVYHEKQDEITEKIARVEEQKQKLGEPKERADRDMRKQRIMMFRSLWLENSIRSFFSLISAFLTAPLDIEIALDLFFFRSGTMVEANSMIIYYINDENLSTKYKKILQQLVNGFNSIALLRKGKPLHVKIAAPP